MTSFGTLRRNTIDVHQAKSSGMLIENASDDTATNFCGRIVTELSQRTVKAAHSLPVFERGATNKTIKRLEGQELLDEHRTNMAKTEMQELYKLRGQTVELTFADAKGHRRMTQFHGRGSGERKRSPDLWS